MHKQQLITNRILNRLLRRVFLCVCFLYSTALPGLLSQVLGEKCHPRFAQASNSQDPRTGAHLFQCHMKAHKHHKHGSLQNNGRRNPVHLNELISLRSFASNCPAKVRSKVVFPHPFGPNKAHRCPAARTSSCRNICFTAGLVLQCGLMLNCYSGSSTIMVRGCHLMRDVVKRYIYIYRCDVWSVVMLASMLW